MSQAEKEIKAEIEEMYREVPNHEQPQFMKVAEEMAQNMDYDRQNDIYRDVSIKPHGIEQTLQEREKTHGKFTSQALISQSMKRWARDGKNWSSMDADMRESIDMILHKVARIVNGDPYHVDSWHDISGYAKLVEDRIK